MHALGLTRHSAVNEFWQFFAKGKSAANVVACEKIAAECENTWGLCSVGCLMDQWLHDIEPVITQNGGAPGWVNSLQYLTGMKFKTLAGSNPPPSAALAAPPSKESRVLQTISDANGRVPVRRRRSAKFLRDNNMLESTMGFSKAKIDSLVIQTRKPVRTRLTGKDSARITEHAFLTGCAHGLHGCDTDLFKFWTEQLVDYGYPCPDRGTWHTKFWNRFKSGNKRHWAKVSTHSACVPSATTFGNRVFSCAYAGSLPALPDPSG